MRNVRTQLRYWLTGILLAALGVWLARVVAPQCENPFAFVVLAVGRLFAGAGLLVIAVGIARRARSNPDHL